MVNALNSSWIKISSHFYSVEDKVFVSGSKAQGQSLEEPSVQYFLVAICEEGKINLGDNCEIESQQLPVCKYDRVHS